VNSLPLETAALIALALDHIREDRLEAALRQLDALTAAAPDLREAWGCKALVARRLGLDDVARQARERLLALGLAPGNG
jgi:Tfp pilus assembly protein PilF